MREGALLPSESQWGRIRLEFVKIKGTSGEKSFIIPGERPWRGMWSPIIISSQTYSPIHSPQPFSQNSESDYKTKLHFLRSHKGKLRRQSRNASVPSPHLWLNQGLSFPSLLRPMNLFMAFIIGIHPLNLNKLLNPGLLAHQNNGIKVLRNYDETQQMRKSSLRNSDPGRRTDACGLRYFLFLSINPILFCSTLISLR